MPADDVLRIANCSGFYGDRLAAAHEMVEGGPIDVLTGDYLAELTMLLLARSEEGYARTYLRQMEEVLGKCVERGIKVVANAGGLNPAGLADAGRALRTSAARRRPAATTPSSARCPGSRIPAFRSRRCTRTGAR